MRRAVAVCAVCVAAAAVVLGTMGSGHSIPAVIQWYRAGTANYGRAGFERAAAGWNPDDMKSRLEGQIVVVTGANAGLGRTTAQALAARGASVHMLCRSRDKGEAAASEIRTATGNADVHLHVVDVADLSAVKAFASSWLASSRPIHALVNNAGVLPATRSVTADGLESAWATAMIQSYLLTGLLLPALLRASPKPARVINVSSGGMYTVKLAVDDLQMARRAKYDGQLQYAFAKRAQVMLTEQWATRLAGSGVVVHAMHPGWAETPGVLTSIPDFAEKQKGQLRTPEQGADTIVWLASAPQAGASSGQFWFDRAPAATHMPWSGTTSSQGDYGKLWAACAAQTGWAYEGSAEEAAVKAAVAGGGGGSGGGSSGGAAASGR